LPGTIPAAFYGAFEVKQKILFSFNPITLLHNAMKAMVFAGPRNLEPSSAIPHRGADRAETVRLLATYIQ
jgi:hypothetical protein